MGHLDPARTTTHLVSLALITSHLRIRMGKEESTIAKAKQQERQITHRSLSLSLKSSLVLIVELGEIGSFDCVFEWIASSCIECEGLECLDVMNGGGWGCIYSPQPLPSPCPFLPTAYGPPLHING
jgi:hypothetical protein